MGFHWQLSKGLARPPGVMWNEPWTGDPKVRGLGVRSPLLWVLLSPSVEGDSETRTASLVGLLCGSHH